MKTIAIAAALLFGVAVGAQAQTTNSNTSQTRTGAGVAAQGTSGMGSGTTTDSRATRAMPATDGSTKATMKSGSMNRRRSSAPSPERTGAGVDPQGTTGMGSGTTTDSRATRAYPADGTTSGSMSTQSTSKKSMSKTKKTEN